ncbi:efflux RND transporter periplasmic adaptor subunit [Halomonas elongata]|uniref:Efflux RND transporter periplasmic adaptor subunit n=3 Tax=Halomonas elongata TaxID=2746 RepID=E1V8G7_HALED|nr:efflux RND transporter periplasmic adaptor subunit [Halomonas elongata]OBX34486.1 efflux pump periplasmic linker BepF [Halomonas elongata]RAW08520.1 efflux RND transporter periplasmic adaptor subunit [Halomonas elongata]WBF17366.1 efflux RND transporter periplasmic adaptor subunit [Halomonas elongata]WPU46203.1 efflux RND transporter periplasmic adaptor subunit [Halomonas elongata DSM 2581]WVI70997.1 efflux RND transporter periplasmic adaptor subunit [Halomonas elongata]
MDVHKMFLPSLRQHLPMVAAMGMGLSVLAGCDSQADSAPEEPPPPQVSVAEVVVKDVNFWDEFTGRIDAVDEVELRPRVSGYLDEIHYSEGQTVEKGEVLFTIDPRPYQADLARAEAELERARARAELTRSEAARAETLAQSRSISREVLDQRRATAAQAEADILAAQAEVERARLNVEFTEVRAPISGRTGRALVTVGNLVSDATPLTSIVSLDKVHVHFYSDEQTFLNYGELARSGERSSSREERTPVRVGLANDTGYPYAGEVDFVDNSLDATTGTMMVRAVLDNDEGRFTPGMFARVQLLGSSAEDAVLIDDKAVLTDQDRKYVYVVDDQGVALRKDIRPGRMADGLRVIETGLEPGERVVVKGAHRIFYPGMQVAAESVDMRGASRPAELAAH